MANYQPATPSPLRQTLDETAQDLATIAHLPIAQELQGDHQKLVDQLPKYDAKKGKFNPLLSALMLGARSKFKGKVDRHHERVNRVSSAHQAQILGQPPSQAGTFATTSSLTDPRSHLTREQLQDLGFQPFGPEKMELVRGRLLPVVHSLDGRRAIRQEDGTYQIDPGSGSE